MVTNRLSNKVRKEGLTTIWWTKWIRWRLL